MTPRLPWVFPYVLERDPVDHPLGRSLLRPVVEARLIGPTAVGTKVGALIDSGSDFTLAAPWMAQEIGVDLRDAPSVDLQIGGAVRHVLLADVTVRLCPPDGVECSEDESLSWETQVGFFERWEAPPWLMVLGQVGFFDHFTVAMSRFAQAVAVEPLEYFDDRYLTPHS